MAVKSVIEATADLNITQYGFDRTDAKGRKIGMRARTETVTLRAATDADKWGYTLEPGVYFTLNMQMTKNGEKWGASQRTFYFKTAEERDAKLANRVADEIAK